MLRFSSQLVVDNLPDEQTNDQFEVIMPKLSLIGNPKAASNKGISGFFSSIGSYIYQPIVEEIIFPQLSFKTNTRRVRTAWYNVPEDIENLKEVSLTLFCPASMATQAYIDQWKKLVYNAEGEYYNSGSVYKKNITVLVLGPSSSGLGGLIGGSGVKFTLHGCFPKSQEEYKFEYSDDPKRFRMLVHFCVDKVTRDELAHKAVLLKEKITSPTAMLGDALTDVLGNSTSTYNLNNTLD